MSCIHLSAHHIAAIIGSSRAYTKGNPMPMPVTCADVLSEANVKAYNERYRESVEPVSVSAKMIAIWDYNPLNLGALYKAIRCYEYQTCDWSDYPDSHAFTIIKEIKRTILDALPGFDAGEWTIEEPPKGRVVSLDSLVGSDE